jgi:hypothetical protein
MGRRGSLRVGRMGLDGEEWMWLQLTISYIVQIPFINFLNPHSILQSHSRHTSVLWLSPLCCWTLFLQHSPSMIVCKLHPYCCFWYLLQDWYMGEFYNWWISDPLFVLIGIKMSTLIWIFNVQLSQWFNFILYFTPWAAKTSILLKFSELISSVVSTFS